MFSISHLLLTLFLNTTLSLESYWKITDDIDENEKFLRDYILNERWRENPKDKEGLKDQRQIRFGKEEELSVEL